MDALLSQYPRHVKSEAILGVFHMLAGLMETE